MHPRSQDPEIVQLPRWSARGLRRAPIVLVGVAAFIASALLLVLIAQQGRVLPGTSVAGVELGGRDPWSTQRLIAPALEREERRPVAVSAPGVRLHVRPVDAGVRFDVDATAAAAYARGREGASAPFARLSAGLVRRSITPRAQVDMEALERWLDLALERIEREASVGDLVIDGPARRVEVVGPHGAIAVDRAASRERLLAALVDPSIVRVELVTETTAPPAPRADIERIAQHVTQALRGPLILRHEGERLEVAPELLARLLVIEAAPTDPGATPQLAIPAQRLQRLLGARGRVTFNSEALDARIVTPDTPPVSLTDLSSTSFTPVPADIEVIPGRSRTTFVARPVAEQIVAMVLAGERSAEADVNVTPADLTTEDAEAGRPTHLLGTFTTFHAAGTARSANIRLLADLLDDRLLAPGEEFSVNRTSGPRRCEDGFLPAGTIIRGELVDTCGGGVSQFGTTLMNGAFFAGLPLEQWQPHSFFISRYPPGREATLNYPELDVRFVNDTDGWLVLRTSHTPDSITVALYGRPRWQEVRADHGERRAPTTFGEELRPTTTLAPGARRVLQDGGGGFTITVTRTRVPVDGSESESVEVTTTVYRPQQRIVEVGVTPPSVSPGAAPGAAARPEVGGAASGG
jgi:vancomycin resistance protein YoaR